MRIPVLLTVASFSTAAMACPGKTATASTEAVGEQSVASLDAAACAKKASLVGSSCSYSTGMMASRVLEQGASFSYTGKLQSVDAKLESNVAAPFELGDATRVIANEVVESVDDVSVRLTWKGKLLEVDGVKYFVVTGFEKASA